MESKRVSSPNPIGRKERAEMALLDRLSLPVWVVDRDQRAVLFANQAALSFFGVIRREDLDRTGALTSVLERLGSRASRRIDVEISAKIAQEKKTVRCRLVPAETWGSAAFVVEHLATPNTIRERTQSLTQRRQAMLQRAADKLPDGLMLADGEGLVSYINPAMQAHSGQNNVLAIGRPLQTFLTDIAGEHEEEARLAVLQQRAWEGQLRQRAPDGSLRTMQVTLAPIHGAKQAPPWMMASFHDVTEVIAREREQERLREQLRETASRLQGMAENVPGVLFQLVRKKNGRYHFSYVGEACPLVLGVAAEDLRNDSTLLLAQLHPEDRNSFKEGLEQSRHEDTPWVWSGRCVTLSGRVRWLQIASRPRRLGAEEVWWDGLIMDITEQKEIQFRFEASERLVSVGELAAGVAHEINNPLAYVLNNLALVLEDLRDSPDEEVIADAIEALEEAHVGADRVRQIVMNLRKLARDDSSDEVAPIELGGVIETAISMANSEIRHRATLVRAYDVLPQVLASELRLGQVFLNLLINAAQAIPEGDPGNNFITIQCTNQEENGMIKVSVEDTGCGMLPEVQSHIFDAFFTTKPVGVGTGLGLSICRNIVREHGGYLEVDSAPGQGTSMNVYLPAVPGDEVLIPKNQEDMTIEASEQGLEMNILVVDDEYALAKSLGKQLDAKGYDVTIAADGADAVQRLRDGEFYDVVLCDLMMPGISGMDVYEQVVSNKPSLADRFLFMTGGAYTDRATSFIEETSCHCLQKPFSEHELHRTLQEIGATVEFAA